MDTVRDIMQTELVTVVPDTSVYDLSRLLTEKNVSGAPVVDVDGEVLGVVSMTDVVRLAADETALQPWPVSTPVCGDACSRRSACASGGPAGWRSPSSSLPESPTYISEDSSSLA